MVARYNFPRDLPDVVLIIKRVELVHDPLDFPRKGQGRVATISFLHYTPLFLGQVHPSRDWHQE